MKLSMWIICFMLAIPLIAWGHPEDTLMSGQIFDRTLTVRGKIFTKKLQDVFLIDESFKQVLTVSEKPGPNSQNFIEIKMGFKTVFTGRLPIAINQVEPYSQSVIPYLKQKIRTESFAKLIKDPDLGQEEL